MRRVLFVDDDPDIRTIGQLALEAVGGFTVRLASSGAEALALARAEPFDLVLLDVMMPGECGPAVLVALRGLTAAPVVFLTARIQPDDVAEYLRGGATAVIAKPFDPMTLADQVRRAAEGGASP